jgi:thymidylate synthase
MEKRSIRIEHANDGYEKQYIDILKHIKYSGFRELNHRTNVETLRIPHAVISVDLDEEFPILRCKQVAWKTALKEILWIMQTQSNNINDLDAHIWDAWADPDGSIGKSYGYQVAKPVTADGITYESQVHYVLGRLASDSSDRRALIDLWNADELHEMNLNPCCFSSHWTVIDGKLNCLLMQRSCDFLVGVPFNTTQYAMLTHLFARHLGVQPGRLTHVMSDVHVYCYESHLTGMDKMIENHNRWYDGGLLSTEFATELSNKSDMFAHVLKVDGCFPRFTIDSDETDFFAISEEDCKVEDYEHMGKITFDVAV